MRIVLLWLCLGSVLAAQTAAPEAVDLPSVRAADFHLTKMDGSEARLNDLMPAGHPVVVEFWATWCTPCLKTMPHLSGLASKFAAGGLVVIGLNMEDPAKDGTKVRKYLEQHPVTYPVAFAPREVFQFMNHRSEVALPKILVFDRSGRLLEHIKTYSFRTKGRLTNAVEAATRP